MGMRKNSVGTILVVLFLLSPFFVLAKSCLVDKSETQSDVYKTINKSLEDGCNFITVAPGEYAEDINIKDGVKISGINKEVVIEGTVTMNGESGLKGVHIDNPRTQDSNGRTIGVKIEKGAKAILYNIEVSNADIGVESSEGSQLTVMDSKMYKNNKAFYIRRGTTVDIRNNEVVDNDEEGIDVRAKINGSINGNKIIRNGEGGIEIVMGESKMKIVNNIINDNHASGIALQFYKDNSGLGDFLIGGNELMRNGNQGITCKRPSGGKTVKQYWAKSTKFEYNRIWNNKRGIIHSGCKFNGPKKWKASRTKKVQEQLMTKLEKLKTLHREMSDKDLSKIINKQIGNKFSSEDKDDWQQQKIDGERKKKIDKIVDAYLWDYDNNVEKEKNIIEKSSKIREFFLGPNTKILKRLKNNLDKYNSDMETLQEIIHEIRTGYILDDASKQIEEFKRLNELQKVYNQYQERFGIWTWVKSLF